MLRLTQSFTSARLPGVTLQRVHTQNNLSRNSIMKRHINNHRINSRLSMRSGQLESRNSRAHGLLLLEVTLSPAQLVTLVTLSLSTHNIFVIKRDSLLSFSLKRCPNLRFVRLVSLYDVSLVSVHTQNFIVKLSRNGITIAKRYS